MAEKTVPQIDTALNRLALIVSTDWIVPDVSPEVDDRWRQAFVASRVADVLAQLCTDRRITALDVAERAWLRGQVEQLVEDALAMFTTVPPPPLVPGSSVMAQFYADVNEARR